MQQYKKLLLTGLVALSSISMANAVCTPPTTLKCACQHPIINSEGKLACGEDYCAKNGKKCMPDGSCCETERYCASSEQGIQCCADGQTCDATKGCVEEKTLNVKCIDFGGTFISVSHGNFCLYEGKVLNWEDAKDWCQKNGMTMPTTKEMCPSWDGNNGRECPELSGIASSDVWSATLYDDDENYAFTVALSTGYILYNDKTKPWFGVFCH